jgi:hypothetical protein
VQKKECALLYFRTFGGKGFMLPMGQSSAATSWYILVFHFTLRISLYWDCFCFIRTILGDPMKFHAQFIVQVKFIDETVRGVEISASARLGVRVRKPLVIATVELNQEVTYVLIEWLGTT